MSEDRLAEEMRKLARQFAPLVIDKPPSEIARILYLAHKRWDGREKTIYRTKRGMMPMCMRFSRMRKMP
jgi:hypothetical protein